ncbi:MGMT family protein [Psychromonas sp. 14N.309.X.WAT.B.A12]|uniref:MGMT family protein n=1 Tax=unclassified Psychromonas TaxID=2614957 RepID=UPI0025B19A26|nr:MGMT family protein [Psychromonas sp. 14N.309.X.WAT.B.A12]MDN2664810.1 MGMT family protein [Psychromonas sp. 14N.309.X.WAT.B.A12]
MDSNKSFNEKCYSLLMQIPRGKVVTYADIAHHLGGKAYQAVGNAMASNPTPIIVPCHRVVNSNGAIGKFALGTAKKIALLKEEGILIDEHKDSAKIVNLDKQRHTF